MTIGQNPLRKDIQPLKVWGNAQARVLIIDNNQAILDSLVRWLNWTLNIEIVGKIRTATLALESLKITQPNIMILSLPQGGNAFTASADAALAAKALNPELRIVVLAWYYPVVNQGNWGLLAKTADAWVFKESILYDLIPTLVQLLPQIHPRNK